MDIERLNIIFNAERKKTLEDILAEMCATTLKYEKVEFKSLLGEITFEINKRPEVPRVVFVDPTEGEDKSAMILRKSNGEVVKIKEGLEIEQ